MRLCYIFLSLIVLLSIHLYSSDSLAITPATSRQAVMDTSWVYVTLKWTCYNTFTSTDKGNFYAGQQYMGEAYLFGGTDDWRTFLHKVEVEKIKPRQGAGIDCSAFVSRCWGTPRHTTGTLPNVSHAIPRDLLKTADILNNPYSHVVLVESLPTDYSVIVHEAVGGMIARVVRRSTSWSRYNGYVPRTLVDLSPDSSMVSFEIQPVGASDAGDLLVRARIWNDGGVPISGTVRVYADDLVSPVGTDTVRVDARKWGQVQVPWSVADLSAGEHTLRIRVTDTLPVESDTTNNQTTVTYVLPLTLSSVQAEVRGDQVRFHWVTQQEWQNQGFHLYRAVDTGTDPLPYRRVTSELIPGAGTSSLQHTYTFVDAEWTGGVSYVYTVTAVAADGREIPYRTLSVTPQQTVWVSDPTASQVHPTTYALRQNWPNPFNTFTMIAYELPERVDVVLTLYDVLGREIRTWIYGDQDAGYYRAQWDGKDDEGRPVSAGIYLYGLRAGTFMETKRMILLK